MYRNIDNLSVHGMSLLTTGVTRGRYHCMHICTGFEIVPIRMSETCQNVSGHVKCPCMVIRPKCPYFCNLQLGLLKLQDTPQADIDQDNVSLAGVLQGAVATELVAQSDTPVCECSRATLLGDNTRFSIHDTIAGGTEHAVGTPFSQSFSVSWTQILQQLK